LYLPVQDIAVVGEGTLTCSGYGIEGCQAANSDDDGYFTIVVESSFGFLPDQPVEFSVEGAIAKGPRAAGNFATPILVKTMKSGSVMDQGIVSSSGIT